MKTEAKQKPYGTFALLFGVLALVAGMLVFPVENMDAIGLAAGLRVISAIGALAAIVYAILFFRARAQNSSLKGTTLAYLGIAFAVAAVLTALL